MKSPKLARRMFAFPGVFTIVLFLEWFYRVPNDTFSQAVGIDILLYAVVAIMNLTVILDERDVMVEQQ